VSWKYVRCFHHPFSTPTEEQPQDVPPDLALHATTRGGHARAVGDAGTQASSAKQATPAEGESVFTLEAEHGDTVQSLDLERCWMVSGRTWVRITSFNKSENLP
jgi:hypothetical protein